MTVSELAQYAVSQVAQNAMPPLPSAWGDGLARRLAGAPRGDAGVAASSGPASSATGRTGGAARSRPTTSGSRPPILQFGGWMDEYVDAALRIQARCTRAAGRRTIVGPWVHGLPDHAYPAPEHRLAARDGPLVRPLAQGRRRTAPMPSRRSPGSTATRRRPSGSRSDSTGSGAPRRLAARRARCARPPASTAALRRASVALHRRGGDRRRRRRHLRAPADRRRPRRLPVLGRRPPTERSRGRPSPRGRHRPDVHGRAARARRSTSSACPSLCSTSARASRSRISCVRLADVAPDGAIEQVSEGILNLTHRDSHAEPTPLEPGRTLRGPGPDARRRLPIPRPATASSCGSRAPTGR